MVDDASLQDTYIYDVFEINQKLNRK